MSSIAYAGHAFDDYVSAEIMEPVAHVVAPETATVPGRPGRVLLSADVEPLEFKVRLLMDSPDALITAQRSEVRRTLRGGYSAPTVRFSGSPASWTSSGATWCARASLTGRRSSRRARPPSRSSRSTPSPTGRGGRARPPPSRWEASGRRGRSWRWRPSPARTWRSRSATRSCDVAGPLRGRQGGHRHGGADGDRGRPGRQGDVTLASDFFALPPGWVGLLFVSCSSRAVRWRERA